MNDEEAECGGEGGRFGSFRAGLSETDGLILAGEEKADKLRLLDPA